MVLAGWVFDMPRDTTERINDTLDKYWIKSESIFSKSSEYLAFVGIKGELLKEFEKKRLERESFFKVFEAGKERSDLLTFQREHSPIKTMRSCSSIPVAVINKQGLNVPINLHINGFGWSFSGLNLCENPFCVVCSRKKAKERAERIHDGLTGCHSQQGKAYFLTFTIPRQNDIKEAIKNVRRRWKKVQEKIQYRFRTLKGLRVSFVKALDITFSEYASKGVYHLHIHAVLMIERGHLESEVQDILKDWVEANKENMLIKANDKGQYCEPIKNLEKLSKYVSKMAGLGLELASQQTKQGKSSHSLSLVQVMEKGSKGSERCLNIYKDFLTAMKGARTIDFTRNWDEWITPASEEEQEDTKEEYSLNIPVCWWLSFSFKEWSLIAERLYLQCMVENDTQDFYSLKDLFEEYQHPNFLDYSLRRQEAIKQNLRHLLFNLE